MSDLIVIVYPSEAKAEEVRQRLFKLQKEYLITINDAVIAVKNDAGAVKLNQLVNTTAVGAASGSFWGLLIGVLFLNPIVGVALGAASGALGGALSDFGINDNFMKELAASIQPGNAALFVLIKNMTADKVLKEIQDAGGTVLKTSLDESKEQILRDALDLIQGFDIDGVTFRRAPWVSSIDDEEEQWSSTTVYMDLDREAWKEYGGGVRREAYKTVYSKVRESLKQAGFKLV